MYSKLSKTVCLFNRLKLYLPSEIMKTLYNSPVHPHLNYSIEPWYGTSLVSTIRTSELQKKAIRAFYNLPYLEHTNNYLKIYSIIEIKDLYKFNMCNYLFRSNASA